MRKVWLAISVVGFVLMTGALIYSETTPPGADRLVSSPLILTGFVLTAVGSIAGWLSARNKGDREP
ncbi:hypothetical protein ABT061_24640 [Streptosporangium sp. NPDC002544]|uniref:hypothetical protein n=1 Tax=Streptosporangium sp. NPDC002544 TaxID=3154538 RepID=UPI0033177B08